MGTIFTKLHQHMDSVPDGSVFVEIGSDRYEGSTAELDRLAGIHGTRLITVDIMPDASQRLQAQLSNTEFVTAQGSKWAEAYQGPPISCLYLDNFDYIWDANNMPTFIKDQLNLYRSHGMTMTNQNSQIEHLTQLMFLYPHLSSQAVVMFDDTYLYNDCWIGKCGPAVVYLLAQGWNIVEHTVVDGRGVILRRVDKHEI